VTVAPRPSPLPCDVCGYAHGNGYPCLVPREIPTGVSAEDLVRDGRSWFVRSARRSGRREAMKARERKMSQGHAPEMPRKLATARFVCVVWLEGVSG